MPDEIGMIGNVVHVPIRWPRHIDVIEANFAQRFHAEAPVIELVPEVVEGEAGVRQIWPITVYVWLESKVVDLTEVHRRAFGKECFHTFE